MDVARACSGGFVVPCYGGGFAPCSSDLGGETYAAECLGWGGGGDDADEFVFLGFVAAAVGVGARIGVRGRVHERCRLLDLRIGWLDY